MKKTILSSILLAIVLALSSCGGNTKPVDNTTTTSTATVTVDSTAKDTTTK